jgi:PAS domain S-box-containing protein
MAPPAVALDRGLLLPRLARAMTASLGLGDVLAAASRAAAELVPDSLVLVWINHDDRLRLRGAAGAVETVLTALPIELDLGEGLPGWVALHRQPVVVEHAALDPRVSQREFLLAERVQWFVGVPLAGRFALEGVLGVFGRVEAAPEPEVVDALGALAAQIALAVEGARLDAHGERRRREAEALAAVSQALAHSLDPRQVSQLIADSVAALLHAHGAAVYRLERDTGALRLVTLGGEDERAFPPLLPPGLGVAGRAVLERRLQTGQDPLDDAVGVPATAGRAPGQPRVARGAGAMAVPLLVNGDTIGALSVRARAGVPFDDDARRLLEAFADQAAVALNNARLFAAERNARAEAQAAEQRFRELVESIDAVVVEFDVATRRALFVNRRAETLLGYPLAAWTAEPDFWLERLHPDDRARVLRVSRAEVAAGRDHVQEYRMLAADGRVVWVRDSASVVSDGQQPPRLRCLQVDISERKRTEALLASEKVVLEMLAAGEPLPGVLDSVCRTVEMQGDGLRTAVLVVEDDRLRTAAAPSLPREFVDALEGMAVGPESGCCGVAAYRRQPVVVEDVADDPRWTADRALALRHGLRACWAMPVLEAGGGVLAVVVTYHESPRAPDDEDRRLIERAARLAGIAIERVRASDALRVSEQRYRTLVTNIPDVVWLVDRAGNTLFISPNVEKISGYTAEELYRAGPAGWFGRIHPDDQTMVRRLFERLFEAGAGTFDVEYRLRHRDGRWIWLHDRAVATLEGHGTTYVYGLYSNITDRKQAEEIRALLLNQVITVQEEERRRIARELHDETAQSLASLLLGLGALQEVRTTRAARAQARELHQIATAALAEVRRLAWGLRPSVLDDLGLVTALERYTEDFARTRGIAVALHTTGLEQHRMPVAVETALYRIMQEALSNVARHAGAHHVRVTMARQDGTVTLVIEDDGQGFDPARPAARPTAARGLGIHTMRERAAVHKGTLTIDAAPGRGTRVAVEIPLAAPS